MFATDWLREAVPCEAPSRSWLLSAHESFGLLVLGFSIARLVWRLNHPAPPPQGTPATRVAAKAGHILLYIATIVLPLAGIARAMSKGDPVLFFGVVIPSLTGRSDLLRAIARLVHGGLVMNLLLALIAGHVIAALWHQFKLKDQTLQRML